MDYIILILNIVIVIGIWIATLLIKNALTSYLKKKGENLATKEDIRDITQKVESVKIDLNKLDRINEKKYELKYNACMKLLTIVDAQFNHIINKDNDGRPVNIDKQYTTEVEARQCHNELLITIDNNEIIKCFLEIVTGNTDNPIVALIT
ncbi:MAG: hypothetical protein WCC06_08035 [Candidatus Aminicenantales bacterium]